MSWKTQMKRRDLGTMVGVLWVLTAGLAVSSPPNTVCPWVGAVLLSAWVGGALGDRRLWEGMGNKMRLEIASH